MSRYKEGSRQKEMYDCFEKKGSEACAALGPSLNLAPSTIKLWIRFWEREKQGIFRQPRKPKEERAAPRETKAPRVAREVDENSKPLKKVPKRIAGYKFNPTGKQRVRCVYMPTRLGWLIEAGPEVSEVRWDDEYGEIAIINKFLKDVTPKDEAAFWKDHPRTEEN